MAGPALSQDAHAERGQDAVLRFVIPGDVSSQTLQYHARAYNAGTIAITVISGMTKTYDGATQTTVDVPVTAAQMTVAPRAYLHGLRRADTGLTYPESSGHLWVTPSPHVP
jgi:hypothetical protein